MKILKGKNKWIVIRVVMDLLILVAIIIAYFIFKRVEPFHRGFFCNDESISFPYKGSTISEALLYIVGFGVPIIIMAIGEILRLAKDVQRQKSEIRVIMPTLAFRDATIKNLVYRLYVVIGYFVLAGCTIILLSTFIKLTVGRLRPHFLAVCQPNWGQVQCFTPHNTSVYVERDVCSPAANPYAISSARKSFPSGHSTFAFYAAVYLVIYMQTRIRRKWLFSYSVRPVLQFACLGIAALVAATRLSDYKHHLSDVLVGSVMGITMAMLTAVYMADIRNLDRRSNVVNDSGLDGYRELFDERDEEDSHLLPH